MTLRDWLPALNASFPHLTAENGRLTSPLDEEYNCIAWAAEDAERWWWPDAQSQFYWPEGLPRSETLEAFEKAYGTLGYVERSEPTWEPGKQKIAVYAGPGGVPTHAARQLSDGWWASKLGGSIDIEHVLTAVEGPAYGSVAVVLARPRA